MQATNRATGFADLGVSGHGLVASILGVLLTSGLAIALMVLSFYSDRSSHDEVARRPRAETERDAERTKPPLGEKKARRKPAGGIVGAGFDAFRWPRPVRPGDALRIESGALEVRPSKSHPDQGVIKLRTTLLDRNAETEHIQVGNRIVARRPT